MNSQGAAYAAGAGEEPQLMREPDYEYRGLIAASWDLLRGDTTGWPDRPFYRKIIAAGGEPALDVGCGTGRLLLDYLSQGLDVEGVDVSPDMLEMCSRKAERMGLQPTLYQQAVESLDLPRTYRTIFIPSSSFQLVIDPAEAEAALERCHQHLEKGGTLVMSIMDISDDTGGEWVLIAEKERADDGLLVRRWLKSRYDPATCLEHTEDRYELMRDGQVVETEMHARSPATRGYKLDEISKMLEQAGFQDVHATSGFTEEAATPEDSIFCIFGTRR